VFKDAERKEICVLYRQFDGYPEGHGKALRNFLKGKEIVNGYSSGDEKNFNGMGCLTAQVIAHFKKDIGNFYVHAAGTRDCWEEYIYVVYPKKHNGKVIPGIKMEPVKNYTKEHK
jgi:hypothetical protein